MAARLPPSILRRQGIQQLASRSACTDSPCTVGSGSDTRISLLSGARASTGLATSASRTCAAHGKHERQCPREHTEAATGINKSAGHAPACPGPVCAATVTQVASAACGLR